MELPTSPHPSLPSRRKWWILLGICLGVLMYALDTSIVNVALPTLVKEFRTQYSVIQWVMLSYLLVINVMVLGAARLGDITGKKKLYLGGLVIFIISSFFCGTATSVEWLIAFRAMQGLGAVMISALGAAIITEAFPPSERGQALGILGSTVALGVTLGPTIGGFLISVSDWRMIFLINIPLGIFTSLVVAINVPALTEIPQKQSFDWFGAIAMSVALMAFSFGMNQGQEHGFNHLFPITLMAIAVLGLILFFWIEKRQSHPLVDLKLFVDLDFTISLFTKTVVFFVLGGMIFIIPFFLELALGYGTFHVGLLLVVSSVGEGLTAPFAGRLSDRHGTRGMILMGLGLMAASCLMISTFSQELTDWGYVLRVAPFGIGLGMFQPSNNSAILGSVPPHRLGITSGLMSLSRTLGQIIGLSLLATVFAALTLAHSPGINLIQASPEALVSGFQITFRIAAFALLIAAAIMIKTLRMYKIRS